MVASFCLSRNGRGNLRSPVGWSYQGKKSYTHPEYPYLTHTTSVHIVTKDVDTISLSTIKNLGGWRRMCPLDKNRTVTPVIIKFYFYSEETLEVFDSPHIYFSIAVHNILFPFNGSDHPSNSLITIFCALESNISLSVLSEMPKQAWALRKHYPTFKIIYISII